MRFRFTNLLTFMLLTVQYTYRHHSISTWYSLYEQASVCVSFCVDDLSTKWGIMCAVCTHIQTRSLIVMCPDRPLLFSFFLFFFLDFDAIGFGWRMCALHIPCSWQCQHGVYYFSPFQECKRQLDMYCIRALAYARYSSLEIVRVELV